MARTHTERFEVRATPELIALFGQAAALSGQSFSDFVRQAALARAEEVIRRGQVTVLPAEEFDKLLASIDEPENIDDETRIRLRRARDTYVDLFGKD